jgi:hypothetical protein
VTGKKRGEDATRQVQTTAKMSYPFVASAVPPLVRASSPSLSTAGSASLGNGGGDSSGLGVVTAKRNVFNAGFRTGLAPVPISRSIVDSEPEAEPGSTARLAQKHRTHPLLNLDYRANADAAGLGYGKKHNCYYKYLSHWTTPNMSEHGDDSADSSASTSTSGSHATKYRSKCDRGFTIEAAALGYGQTHRSYYSYLSPQRTDDVMRNYPNGDAVLRFRAFYSD